MLADDLSSDEDEDATDSAEAGRVLKAPAGAAQAGVGPRGATPAPLALAETHAVSESSEDERPLACRRKSSAVPEAAGDERPLTCRRRSSGERLEAGARAGPQSPWVQTTPANKETVAPQPAVEKPSLAPPRERAPAAVRRPASVGAARCCGDDSSSSVTPVIHGGRVRHVLADFAFRGPGVDSLCAVAGGPGATGGALLKQRGNGDVPSPRPPPPPLRNRWARGR